MQVFENVGAKLTDRNFNAISEGSSWLFSLEVISASLLLVYFAFLVMKWGYKRSKVAQDWMGSILPNNEEKIILNTLPYYLAISHSCCEVISIINIQPTPNNRLYTTGLCV